MSSDKSNNGGNGNNPDLFIDGDPYQWDKASITGAQIRALAHLPQSVLIYQRIRGKPDRPIGDDTSVDLTPPGPERFSTQAPGSQAGC